MQTITLEEAQARLLEVVHCVMSEKVELLRSIDRILAEDVYAHVSQPPFERSAMDGYAVRSIWTASSSNPVCLKVIDRVCAGEVTDKSVHAGEAIRIMTGAMIPEGADCVVKQEDTDYGQEQVKIYVSLAPQARTFTRATALAGKGKKSMLI